MARINKIVTAALISLCLLLCVVYYTNQTSKNLKAEPHKTYRTIESRCGTGEESTDQVYVNPAVIPGPGKRGIQQTPVTVK